MSSMRRSRTQHFASKACPGKNIPGRQARWLLRSTTTSHDELVHGTKPDGTTKANGTGTASHRVQLGIRRARLIVEDGLSILPIRRRLHDSPFLLAMVGSICG